MREASSNSWNVLVGGAGIAASAACMRLCALGLRPLVLSASRPLVRGIEAIPEAALPLFLELGMKQVLEEARASVVEGFENHWRDEERAVRKGRWIHVERTRLAMAAMHEALRRGATVWTCHSLPELIHEPGAVGIVHQGAQLRFDAAIDATGRSAVWSRPVCRHGHQVADLYVFPAGESPRGRVVRLHESWAYRLGQGDSTTAAIIAADGKHRGKPDVQSRRLLGLRSSRSEYLGRRPAFPQWAENPIRGRRLAVGDAALAYDPVAGQGIRFALSSAFAAVAVINTLKNLPGEGAAAERFYETLIRQSRQRHLQSVRQLWQTEPRRPVPVSLPAVVVFSRQNLVEALGVFGRINIQKPDRKKPRYTSTVNLGNQVFIEEELIHNLRSPQWPSNLFGTLNKSRIHAGRVLYGKYCLSCHTIAERASTALVRVCASPLAEVGTDPAMATNIGCRKVDTGVLEGSPRLVLLGKKLEQSDFVLHVAGNVGVGALLDAGLSKVQPSVVNPFRDTFGRLAICSKGSEERKQPVRHTTTSPSACMDEQEVYRARPLDGIWATAPYLHNGSVPSLYQLLLPGKERVTKFYVGSREFDPSEVGFEYHTGPFEFDTSQPGNSKNGHEYGTDLSADDRQALLEYLKTL